MSNSSNGGRFNDGEDGFMNHKGYDVGSVLPAYGARMSRYELNKTVMHQAASGSNYGQLSSSIDAQMRAKREILDLTQPVQRQFK